MTNATEQPHPETTTHTQETASTNGERLPDYKLPLTHQIQPGQLERIRRCLTDPANQAVAQNRQKHRDKKDEGRQRPQPRKDNAVQTQDQTANQNGSQVQAMPPAVPRASDSQFDHAMSAVAAVPYKLVALRGLLFGAVAGTIGTLCVVGVKKLVARFSSSTSDDGAGFPS